MSNKKGYADLMKKSIETESDSSIELLQETRKDNDLTKSIMDRGASVLNKLTDNKVKPKEYSGRLSKKLTIKYNEFMEMIPEDERRGVHTQLLNLGIDIAIDVLKEQMKKK